METQIAYKAIRADIVNDVFLNTHLRPRYTLYILSRHIGARDYLIAISWLLPARKCHYMDILWQSSWPLSFIQLESEVRSLWMNPIATYSDTLSQVDVPLQICAPQLRS